MRVLFGVWNDEENHDAAPGPERPRWARLGWTRLAQTPATAAVSKATTGAEDMRDSDKRRASGSPATIYRHGTKRPFPGPNSLAWQTVSTLGEDPP